MLSEILRDDLGVARLPGVELAVTALLPGALPLGARKHATPAPPDGSTSSTAVVPKPSGIACDEFNSARNLHTDISRAVREHLGQVSSEGSR